MEEDAWRGLWGEESGGRGWWRGGGTRGENCGERDEERGLWGNK